MLIDKELKLSLPVDSILDILFQIKNDRSNMAYKIKESEEYRINSERILEARIEGLQHEKNDLEYENLKLRSKVTELENKISLCEKKIRLMLPIPKELP